MPATEDHIPSPHSLGANAPAARLTLRLLAVVLVALGIWVAASPASVPGLTQPSNMQMPMGMGP